MLAVVLAHVLTDDGVVARAKARRKLQMHRCVVHFVHLNRHNLLQLLYAALHLNGLRRFVSETFYKVLYISYFLLLVLVSAQLLFVAFGTQFHVLVVLHLVVVHLSARYLYGAVSDVVDECAVVAHQNQSLCALLQESLKPTDTLDVEVVGRLVEQQYVGASQQNLCQLDTHTPATAELLRRAVEVVACESQTGKRAFYLCLVVVATHHHVVVVLLRELLHQFGIFRAFVVGALSHLPVELLYLRLQLSRVGERLACLLLYGRVILQHHHLRQIADRGV